MTQRADDQAARLADAERQRILYQDILGHKSVQLYPLAADAAAAELTRFSQELWRMPNMEGYFDRRHLANLRLYQNEAEHGFATLPSGGILEILSIPTLPAQAMGFQIFSVFDPRDANDRGRFIGYTVWALEKGHAGHGHAEAVRMAFDIFPPFREHRDTKVRFTNHDIYNFSRQILCRYQPQRFLVDAQSQISQTRTGERLKRTIYYLKRGYYPPDQKPLADRCLVRLVQAQPVGPRTLLRLLRSSRAQFWIYPIDDYRKRGEL